MTELETLQRAKMYIDKMANGINPLDDTPVKDGDVINNVRISRCLFYVSDTLRKVIENDGVIAAPKVRKQDFSMSADEIEKFEFSETPIPVSEIAKRINELTDTENSKKFSHRMITDWLIKTEFLVEIETAEGEKRKRPTQNGVDLGITVEERQGQRGIYHVVLYNQNAQKFITDNIFAILDNHKDKKSNQGLPWSDEDEEKLMEMYKQNFTVTQIAATLNRSNGGVRARLEKFASEKKIIFPVII